MMIKTYFRAIQLLIAVCLFSACTGEDLVINKKDKTFEGTPGISFMINAPKVSAKSRIAIDENSDIENVKTRTGITHTIGNGADAYWSANDYIYVQDHNGTWQKSTAIEVRDGGAAATFTLPLATYDDGCKVNYTITGDNVLGESTTASIHNVQTQAAPNDFSHAGISGDCGFGIAHATDNPKEFDFTIKHVPSYLCFLPRCRHVALGKNIKLINIKVVNQGTDQLAATYDINHFGGSGLNNRDNTITLTPTGGVPLNYQETNIANACYMVIAPGTHHLTISYTIRDNNGTSTDITQEVNTTFESGKIYDVTVDLMPKDYPLYYMWDAQKDYFWNTDIYPWGSDFESTFYDASRRYTWPSSKTEDPLRWYNDTYFSLHIPYSAQTELFKKLPNVNEMLWYCQKGDPHFDANGATYLRITNGHLEKFTVGGMWFRKRQVIVDYLKTHEGYPATLTWDNLKEGYKTSPTGTVMDFRVRWYFQWPVFYNVNRNIAQGRPANINDYFFLPMLGSYHAGQLTHLGNIGYYWSSSADPDYGSDPYTAYCMSIEPTAAGAYSYNGRAEGFSVGTFE